jgi:hypothetical protein
MLAALSILSLFVITIHEVSIQTSSNVMTYDPATPGADHEALAKASSLLLAIKGWSTWNSFTSTVLVVSGHGRFEAGADVELTVRLDPAAEPLKLPFQVEVAEPNKICWSYQMLSKPIQPLVLRTYRCMLLDIDASTHGIRLRQVDRNWGPVSLIVRMLFSQQIAGGFDAMAQDMRVKLTA